MRRPLAVAAAAILAGALVPATPATAEPTVTCTKTVYYGSGSVRCSGLSSAYQYRARVRCVNLTIYTYTNKYGTWRTFGSGLTSTATCPVNYNRSGGPYVETRSA